MNPLRSRPLVAPSAGLVARAREGGSPASTTSFPAVDRQLAAALGTLRGVPLYQDLTARAEIEGGAEQAVTVKGGIEKVEPAPTRPDLFQVPAGFH